MVDNMAIASRKRGTASTAKSKTNEATSKKGAKRSSVKRVAKTAKQSSAKSSGARAKRATKQGAKRVAKRTPKKQSARSGGSRTRRGDPRGGLTQAGRDYFEKTEGAHLKPGVKKRGSEMSPTDLRRKGSWAVRFYGRRGALPALTDTKGEPTRFALSAAAWGEPVPKTVAAARRIAAKGKRLLARYVRAKEKAATKKR